MAAPATFPAAVAAVLAQNGACATAFGDSTSTPKFQGVLAATQVQIPYARLVVVPGGSVTRESQDGSGAQHSYHRGELQVDVFAAGESSAETLGNLIVTALSDPNVAWAGGRTLELFLSAPPFFVPEPDAGPGTSIVYHRVHQFLYLNELTSTPGP